ncbi:MAG: alpha/beta hydrolase [Clostridia bacterium]|nr:alpha/beta hydrolase [Clostridia bacterium]
MKNYVIIPGSNNSPYDNWYKSVYEGLKEKGYNTLVLFMPQENEHNYKAWEKIFKAYKKAGVINKHTTIICHDISTMFIAKAVVKTKTQISGIISVGILNTILGTEEDKLNKTFIVPNKILEKTINYLKFYHIIASSNDPFIETEDAQKMAELSGAKLHIIENAGHFTAEDGYTKFSELLNIIESINEII